MPELRDPIVVEISVRNGAGLNTFEIEVESHMFNGLMVLLSRHSNVHRIVGAGADNGTVTWVRKG